MNALNVVEMSSPSTPNGVRFFIRFSKQLGW
jgi:hypothetical protein